jgi:hypothetical protein
MRGAVEQRTQDHGPVALEVLPQLLFRPALLFRYRSERQEDGAVGQVGAGDDLF